MVKTVTEPIILIIVPVHLVIIKMEKIASVSIAKQKCIIITDVLQKDTTQYVWANYFAFTNIYLEKNSTNLGDKSFLIVNIWEDFLRYLMSLENVWMRISK